MKIDIANELARLDTSQAQSGLRYRNLQDFHVDGGSSLGVALLEPSISPERWEVNDDGDELLMVLHGKILVELRLPNSAHDWKTIAAGQCLLIQRGTEHAVSVLEDTAVLFMRPREGYRKRQTGS